MTMTGTEAPRLETPTGGTLSHPENPKQWHGHPYVWAWNVALGATSRNYIESACQAAQEEGAPPDAVYKTRDDDPSMPSTWVTVGMLTNADQQARVREYAQALVDHADALKNRRPQSPVQPLHEAQPGGRPDAAPVSEAGGRMTGMDSSTDSQPEEGSIDIGPSAIERMYPLTYGPIAIHLGIDHYREDNVEECLRRARAFFQVFDDSGLPLLRKADGTRFSAEDVDEKFVRHHLGRHPGFGRTSDEEFDEHVAKLRAKYAAPAGA